jgi:hypothetical protein
VRAQASRKVEVWWSKSREEPGAHKQRHPVNQRQISIFGETGSTQFLERGFGPALFLIQPSTLGHDGPANPILEISSWPRTHRANTGKKEQAYRLGIVSNSDTQRCSDAKI